MKHHYAVEVAEHAAQPDGSPGARFDFTFESHDDLHAIVERLREKRLFDDNETRAFVAGLKVLGSVLLAHRNEPLFAEFAGAFGSFMKRLKAHPGPAATAS
jgi:hypothetical protein